jgi:hypothetical protein
MPVGDNQSGQVLVQYLLDSLPAEETERLDELSVTDDEFATRLSVAENDSVDAYVRRELATDDADRFRSGYASSPRRLEKLRFAESLFYTRSGKRQPR